MLLIFTFKKTECHFNLYNYSYTLTSWIQWICEQNVVLSRKQSKVLKEHLIKHWVIDT